MSSRVYTDSLSQAYINRKGRGPVALLSLVLPLDLWTFWVDICKAYYCQLPHMVTTWAIWVPMYGVVTIEPYLIFAPGHSIQAVLFMTDEVLSEWQARSMLPSSQFQKPSVVFPRHSK